MTKRVGILGLIFAAALAVFQPAVASAQDRYGYRDGRDRDRYYDNRGWRADDHWRREHWRNDERREWRDREWREHEWRERYAYPGYYSGPYGYTQPAPYFGFEYYGR